jgi:excinuclease UvrABC nuclease subunit
VGMQLSWSRFELLTDINIKKLYDMPAVYVLWTKYTGERWKCFFVGQTEKIKTTLYEFLSESEQNEEIKKLVHESTCAFNYALTGSKSERNGIEKFLYEHYRPEFSNNPPDVEPIEVNLP